MSSSELLASMFFAFLISSWVRRDARRRGRSEAVGRLWGIETFLLAIVFLPLWLLTRPRLRPEVMLSEQRTAD